MYKSKKFLGIIPARAGSKRLPKKNIRILGDKPLISWSIDAAKNSEYLDNIIITTDSDEIISISKNHGIDVPFKRPSHLAEDDSTSVDTVYHAIDYLESINKTYDYLVLLQPTSPLRSSHQIDEAIEMLMSLDAHAVVSVKETEYNVNLCNTLPENNSMENFFQQDNKNKYYCLNGAIYICDIKKFLQEKTFFVDKSIYAYKMDAYSSVDIDTLSDFKLAEFFLKNNALKDSNE